MKLPAWRWRLDGTQGITQWRTERFLLPSTLATQAVGEIVYWRPGPAVTLFWMLILVWYPLFSKNQTAWHFLSPEPEVTWRRVAIIIRVVLLSPYLCIRGVYLSSIHYSQSINHAAYILTKDPIRFLNLKLKHGLKVINFPRRVAC